MECRSWASDKMEESYKCLLTQFETSFNCRLTKKTKKGFLTILNRHLGGKKIAVMYYQPDLLGLPLVAAGTERSLRGVDVRIRGAPHRCIGNGREVLVGP